ncbi:MAG: hypothetical protein JSV46_04700, partial [Candidatus Aminicenantes bacterium]
MNKSRKAFRNIQKSRLIALLTPQSQSECVKAYEMLRPFNVVLEVAMRSEYAVEGIKAIKKKYPDACVLAGTVMTREQAEEAIQAGAAGIVSADYIPAVVDACVEKDIMCVPGGLSDVGKQLVRKAEGYGCSLEELRDKYPYQWTYKLFPAFSGKLSNIDLSHSWKGPYKNLTVIYTGGITLGTLRDAVRKDPDGIFCASALTKSIREPARMKQEVQQWKDVLNPPAPKAKKISKTKRGEEPLGPRVVTFGEMMIRLSPPPGIRLQNARNFELNFGGAEANVAVSLARHGINTSYVTV